MQDTLFTDEKTETSQERVRKELISIFNGQSKSLPTWESLETIAEAAKENSENRYFAILVYYAIKDLLKPVGGYSTKFVGKNDKKKTLKTEVTYHKKGSLESTNVESKILKPDGWEMFKGVDLETLNRENHANVPILKMNNYLKEGSLLEGISEWSNTKSVSKNIDKVFEDVIKKTSSRQLTFEQVIEQLTPKKIHTEPLPQVPGAIEPEEIKKLKKELSFEDCFIHGKEGIEITLKVIEQLGAVNRIQRPRQGQYIIGIITGLQSEKLIRSEISIDKLHQVFYKKLNLAYKRNSRIYSDYPKSAYNEGVEDAKSLIEKFRKELKTKES